MLAEVDTGMAQLAHRWGDGELGLRHHVGWRARGAGGRSLGRKSVGRGCPRRPMARVFPPPVAGAAEPRRRARARSRRDCATDRVLAADTRHRHLRSARAIRRLAGKGIVGRATLPTVLENAGAENADMVIAVTRNDETNMIVCQLASSLFNVSKKIARIRTKDFLEGKWNKLYNKSNIPIDVIISPEVALL